MKHKTSVLIVNSKKRTSKTYQVPTRLILHWRKYAVTLSLMVIALVLVTAVVIYKNTSRNYQQKLDRANFVQSQIDLDKANIAFASIDSGMYRVNTFLNDRGLQRLGMENVGGIGLDFDIAYINEFADFYLSQLHDLENILNEVPIGAPYDGNISSEYGYRRNPFSRRSSEFHTGIDFKGVTGDSIRTTGGGTITFAGYRAGYGRCVIVEHNENLQTLYGHLRKINVEEGENVLSGQVIGLLGNSGRSTGPHLHYEIIVNGKRINPIKYVSVDEEESYG